MVLTYSTMLPLGTAAPAFKLKNVVDGREVSLSDFKGRNLLVMFICKHCPYVTHVQAEITKLTDEYRSKTAIVAISSNDSEKYTEDSPEKLREFALEQKFNFPLLFDASQETAKAYTAACTPDFFVFNDEHKLVYRGQLDDSRPGNDRPLTGADLRAALDAVIAGRAVEAEQKPSCGCNIKWKPGNEPKYFG